MLLIDDSLSLINRTGAHFIARTLVAAFGGEAQVRRWRLLDGGLPRGLAGKLVARALRAELRLLGARPLARWPEPKGIHQRLFLDPLYVLRARLAPDDLVLCHDVGPLTHADLYEPGTVALYRQAYARLRSVGPRMVFVSETSRRAFEAQVGSTFKSLHTIPLYVRPASAAGEETPPPGVHGRFLLSVGALERRKNHASTIAAYALSRLHEDGVQLVICGSRGDATSAITALAARTPGVQLCGYVGEAELRWLYQHAQAFVLPSLLEGFGMPALEAAQHGLPCVVSHDSALSEALGGLGLQAAPLDLPALAQQLRAAVDLSAEQRARLAQDLRAHAAAHSQERFLARWRAHLVEAGALPAVAPTDTTAPTPDPCAATSGN